MFRILSLDGGGSLGVYSLGILSEVEASIACPLHESFDLIYGTSTGSVIGSMIALGHSVEEILDHYLQLAPDVMGNFFPSKRTSALRIHGEAIFGDRRFDALNTPIGIVTTDLQHNRPMVFKTAPQQAHGMQASFEPGFGCMVIDAVVASCAAYPFFEKQRLATSAGEKTLVDGGFSANNPALLALTDAIGPMAVSIDQIRLLSIGTGNFPLKSNLITRWSPIETFMTLLGTNSRTIDGLRRLLFPTLNAIRVDDTYSAEAYRTNFLEADVIKLKALFQLGRKSFGEYEQDILGLVDPR